MSDQEHEEPQQEYFENVATDVEAEDIGEPPMPTKPWDPGKIRITTKTYSMRQIVDMVNDKELDLAPDFQRMYVWKPIQRSRLIESILLGIPLPAFYFNQDQDGILQVVDGVQRLTTVHGFTAGGEALTGLEYLKDLEGCTFGDLGTKHSALKRRLQQTQIFANVIEPQTPDEVKFDVFKRINTGGSPLTNQEIRHCMSRTPSRDLLKELTSLESFHEATTGAFKNERRMADREVALRFCAFRTPSSIEQYVKANSLDSFLLEFIRRVDGRSTSSPPLSREERQHLITDFDRAMRGASAVFGKYAFRKYPNWAKARGPMNRALFESWAVALADHEPEELIPHKTKIANEARKAFDDRAYFTAITQGTGDAAKVKLRFLTARSILKKVLK